MANYPQTKNIIDTNIATNHNEEITAVVLNAVLTAIINYTKDVNFDLSQALTTLGLRVGSLNNLNTVDKSSIVNAINELTQLNGFDISEKILTNGQSFPFPAMSKGEAFVIRIFEYDG